MSNEYLAAHVRQLAERIARLEDAAPPPVHPAPAPRAVPGQEILDRLADGDAPDLVRYGGAGRWFGDLLAWQRDYDWGEVRQRADEAAARVCGALGNAVRLRIVATLLSGPATTAALTAQLDQPSTGQLFHHLKELLTVGLVHQPVRGTYAVRRQDVIPLLAVIAAGADLAASGGFPEPA